MTFTLFRVCFLVAALLALPSVCRMPVVMAAGSQALTVQQRLATQDAGQVPDQPAAAAERPQTDEESGRKPAVQRSLFSSLLKALIGQSDSARTRLRALAASVPRLAPELQAVFIRFCPDHTVRGAVRNMAWVFFFSCCGLAAGGATAWLLRRRYFAGNGSGGTPEKYLRTAATAPEKLLAALITALPSLIGLVVFCMTAYGLYFTMAWVETQPMQLLFLALLLTLALIRLVAVLSGIVFSPHREELRLLPLSSGMALLIHRLVTWGWGYCVVTFMFAVVVEHLGADPLSVALIKVLAGSLLLAITAVAVVTCRLRIRDHLLAGAGGAASWGMERLASLWHLLALLYMLLLWVLMITTMAAGEHPSRGAFLVSFFILPLWLVADRLIQWLAGYAIKTLKLDEAVAGASSGDAGGEGRQHAGSIAARVMPAARAGLVAILGFWLASLWGYELPFLSNLIEVAVDSLVIIALALVLWRTISTWIEVRIAESTPERPADQESHDDEWGPHTALGRSLTLLPIVRKFVGIILVVLVTMTVLSSLGVDIGPLLAGAGVIGLAIGFGAQKIVSDIFSGFFYLLDDAFRVGEYLTAGSISGTVEKITLRNLMLRHHRGMLQIVPHSELGPITNFMRGGIIEKFSLDFPYDADIDKIRKIIKRVGQEMLDDPELGPNFLKPMKSQGVREITNSVMTIRVKFTARPGTHFVIRREAFRRITLALNAKGIYYAHRKVIVDLPQPPAEQADAAQQAALAGAAGAAARRVLEQEQEMAAEAANERGME